MGKYRTIMNNFYQQGICYSEDKKTLVYFPKNFEGEFRIDENVIRIANKAFENCTHLTSIHFPDSIVDIGERAFYNCTSLLEVSIPDGVQMIDSESFKNCTSLKSIKLSKGVIVISDSAFENCSSLETISIPESVNFVAVNSFCGCTSLKSFIVAKDNPHLSSYSSCLFSKDLSVLILAPNVLESLEIPQGTKIVDKSAFEGCSVLPKELRFLAKDCEVPVWGNLRETVEQLIIGESVEDLKQQGLFSNFYALNSVCCLSSSLNHVGEDVFAGTPWADNAVNWENGLLLLGNSVVQAQKNIYGKCIIKDGISSIADSAFCDCKELTYIEGGPIHYIGQDAFSKCVSLKTVTFSGDMQSLKVSTFAGCVQLQSVELPKSLVCIEREAFKGCESLKDISLPRGLKEIQPNAFKDCKSLVSISLPPFVSLPLDYREKKLDMFSGCENLTKASLHYNCIEVLNSIARQIKSLELWGNDSCEDYSEPRASYNHTASLSSFISLKYVKICKNIPVEHYKGYDGKIVFKSLFTDTNRDNIVSLAFEDSEIIPYSICKNMKGLEKVIISGNCKKISQDAFCGCLNLKVVVLPDSLVVIDKGAFANCPSLHEINIPKSIRIVVSGAFDESNAKIHISADKYIYQELSWGNENAFEKFIRTNEKIANFSSMSGCTIYSFNNYANEEDLVIPEGFEEIAPYTFIGEKKLKRVTLPSSMRKIGAFAFSNCSSLASIKLNQGLLSIEAGAFNKCFNLSYIELPDSLNKLGCGAFNKCSNIQELTLPVSLENCGLYLFGQQNTSKERSNNISIINFRTLPIRYLDEHDNALSYFPEDFGINSIICYKTKDSEPSPNRFSTLTLGRSVETPKVSDNNLSTIIFGRDVEEIPKNFCANSHSLEKVFFEATKLIINRSAFGGCENLMSVEGVEYSIKIVENNAFDGCSSLSTIDLSGTEDIGYQAFKGCKELNAADLQNCRSLGMEAFDPQVKILNVKFDGTCSLCPNFWSYDFESSYSKPEPKGIEMLKSLVIDDEIHFSDNLVPYGSAGIDVKKAVFERETDTLPAHFFRNCKKLKSVVLPRNLKIISTMAFMGCESLEEIDLPESIEIIEKGAFAYCKSLKRIVIPSKVTSITDYCFYECSKLKYVELPSNLLSLCPGCFYGCCSIDNLELPATLEKIGRYAFKNCKISELVVPESVSYAEFDAFSNSGLTTLTWLSPHVGTPNTFEYEHTYWKHGDEESETIYSEICSDIHHLHLGPLVTKVPSYFPNAEIIADNTSLSTELSSRANFGYMWDYKSNADNWENGALYYGEKLIEVKKNIKGRCVIKAGTKVISREAFRGCGELYEIILPESVTEIKIGAFEDCKSLKSVILPRKLKEIPENAFRHCSSLQRIDGACEGLEFIGDYAFDGCIALISLCNRDFVHFELPISLKDIGYGVFSNSSIQSCNIQLGFYSIPDGLFAHCSELTSVTLSKDIKHIGKKAFYDCDKLENIQIPQSVLSIGEEAFAFEDYRDISWISDEEKAKRHRLKGLKHIEIPYSIKMIESLAFARCNQLSECTILGEGMEFGNGVFYGCENLSKVSLPRGILKISDSLFYGCKSLSAICLDDSIASIGSGAFEGCSLTEIHLPKNLKNIGAFAFKGNNLQSVRVPLSVDVLGEGCLSYNTQLVEVVLPSQISYIPKSLFCGDVKLIDVKIPSGVSCIGESAFEGCESISNIVIPASVSKIGKTAFCNCKSISSITIPNSVGVIENETFEGCENLSNLIFSYGLERIETDIIKGTRIKQLLLPESINYIHDNAFYSCQSLKYVILQCGINEDWGTEVFPAKCIVIYQGANVSQLLKNIDKKKFARWAADAADFEQYVRDSFYAAYEGEYDPNGDYL